MLDPELEAELLRNAEVFNVVLRRDEARQLVLASPMPRMVSQTYDLRDASATVLIRDAMLRLFRPGNEVVRVIGAPVREAGLLIEVTMETAPMRVAMLDYGIRILILSAVISVITAVLLFFAMRALLLKPIKRVAGHMQRYAAAPEDEGVTALEPDDALALPCPPNHEAMNSKLAKRLTASPLAHTESLRPWRECHHTGRHQCVVKY